MARTSDQPYGFKIFESPHKESVMGMLLLKRGYNHCIRWLADHGMPKVSYRTLRSFKDNYMSNLDKDVAEKYVRAILDEESKGEEKIADGIVYSQLSTAQTYKKLLDLTGAEINLLEKKKEKQGGEYTENQLKILGTYIKSMEDLRTKLEVHSVESEVELTKRNVAKEVSKIALVIMKGEEEKQKEFVKKVDEYLKNV